MEQVYGCSVPGPPGTLWSSLQVVWMFGRDPCLDCFRCSELKIIYLTVVSRMISLLPQFSSKPTF